jgi:metal transporter CNNM
LKEFIAMHSNIQHHGGDLQSDTVTIIGATLDLQDKTVLQAMTPIQDVFMLHIDAKLDYDTLRKICSTGHSRVPVYEWVEVSLPRSVAEAMMAKENKENGNGSGEGVKRSDSVKKGAADESVMTKVKKIIGILLVKQCVLLDPEGQWHICCPRSFASD